MGLALADTRRKGIFASQHQAQKLRFQKMERVRAAGVRRETTAWQLPPIQKLSFQKAAHAPAVTALRAITASLLNRSQPNKASRWMALAGRRLIQALVRKIGNVMAHEVTLDISTKFVLHKDVQIEVKKDGKKLGTALVSKGNMEWVPSGNSVNKKRLSWAKFAELMEEHGKDVKIV